MRKRFHLNNQQLEQLSGIAGNISVLFFGTVLAPIFTEIDKVNPLMIVLGSTLAVAFLLESLLLLKGEKHES